MEKLMPNMLDYERLVRRVADLNVEIAMLKGINKNRFSDHLEDARWDKIENSPEIGTLTEEKRLRKIIRDWEERYDILCELFMNQAQSKTNLDWYDAKMSLELRRRKQMEQQAKIEKRTLWLRSIYTKIQNIGSLIKKRVK
jgi:hypothetical protein